MGARVLVTNDDGVAAPGISALAASARALGYDVVVAAPLTEASGMSAALTAVTDDGRIVLERRTVDGRPAYGVGASPAYIAVLAGLGVFGPPPDLVLSGINRGANAGHAVLHSGTVGAALTAANAGARALAVSLDVLHPAAGGAASGGAAITVPDDDVLHWSTAGDQAASLLGWLAETPPGTVLNLNVPDRPAGEVAGLRQAELAAFGQARMAIAETGDSFVRTTIELTGDRVVPGTDIAWLIEGYATVTAIRPPTRVDGLKIPTQRRPAD
ncbi:5'/3'-nucleotidase SurE [Micromonosporaceae bacterium Da 78-11]